MAIAFDAVGASGNGAGVTSISWSHTCTGADRLLLVGVASNAQVSGVTYNSVALTLAAEINTAAGGLWTALWYLKGPATGANTVVVTHGSGRSEGQSVSYTGVDQTTPIGTAGSSEDETTGTTGGSVVISSATGEVVVSVIQRDGTDGIINDASETDRYDSQVGVASEWMFISEKAGAASVTMQWTGNGVGEQWGMVAAPFKPVAAAGAPIYPPFPRRIIRLPQEVLRR